MRATGKVAHRVAFGAILATVVLLACAPPVTAGPKPGDSIGPLETLSANHKIFSWKPGKVTLFSFCAFWCDTWKEQNRRIDEARHTLAGLPVDIITVSIDGRWSDVPHGRIDGTVLVDTGRNISNHLGIDRIPYTIVVNQAGQVTFTRQGIARSADITAAVRAALEGEDKAGVYYLTFDDFPSRDESLDDRLLDTLRADGAQATFFCVCNRLNPSANTACRAAKERYSLQIHCWDHSLPDVDTQKCDRAIRSVGGKAPSLYRPTGKADTYRLSGEKVQMVVVNPYDFERPGTSEITRRVLQAIKPGVVVLLHAGVSQTVEALPDIIRGARNLGLRPDVLR